MQLRQKDYGNTEQDSTRWHYSHVTYHVTVLFIWYWRFTKCTRMLITPHTTQQPFTALSPGLPRWASARRNLLLDFMVQGERSKADTVIIWLGTTPSGLISDPPPSSLHFYAWCPSCCNPPTLSWLATGTLICWLAYPVASIVAL